MVRCEGRPGAACPDGRNDESVKNSQGDLMLCRACEIFRFPYLATSKSAASSLSLTESSAMQSKSKSTTTTSSMVSTLATSAQNVQPSSSMDKTATPTAGNNLVQCELLYFVNGVYGKHPDSMIRTTVLDFYREDEIMNAKLLLVRAADGISDADIHSFSKNRIGTNKVKASVDDIMNIFRLIDESCTRGKLPMYCAVSMSRVPLIADELSDLAYIKLELSQLRQQVSELSQLRQQVSDLSTQLSNSCTRICHSVRNPVLRSDGDFRQSVTLSNDRSLGTAEDTDVSGLDRAETLINEPVTDVNNTPVIESARASVSLADIVKKSAPTPAATNSNDGFQTVSHKKKRNSKLVVGSRKDNSQFSGVIKKAVVRVSRLDCSASTDMVVKHLTDNDITVYTCFEVGSTQRSTSADDDQPHDNQRKYTTMRLCVSCSDLAKIYSTDLWPEGVTVRRWVFKDKGKQVSTN